MNYYEKESNSVLLHLKGLPKSFCNAQGIRKLLCDVNIPSGEVHVLGGHNGQAFIKVESPEEAIKAIRHDGQEIGDQKVEIRLSDQKRKLKAVEEFRDEGRPSWAATASFIMKLTTGASDGETSTNSLPKSETELEAEHFQEMKLEIPNRDMSHSVGGFEGAGMNFGLAMMGVPPKTESPTKEAFTSRHVVRAPLLPFPDKPAAIPPLCPEFASFNAPTLLPLTIGGYWVRCNDIPAAWEPKQFVDLLVNKMGIAAEEFTVKKMMNDQAYVVFFDQESHMKFLKHVGYVEDAEVPKLDESILCGITARPCAECNYSFHQMQENREKQFNGPVPRKRSGNTPPEYPRGRSTFNRGFRGGNFHSEAHQQRRVSPMPINRGGINARRGRIFQTRGGFRGRYPYNGPGSEYFERRRQESRSSHENKHREADLVKKMDSDEPPRKILRLADKELGLNESRNRLRYSSTSSSGTDKEREKKDHRGNPSRGENESYSMFNDRKWQRQGRMESPRGYQCGYQ